MLEQLILRWGFARVAAAAGVLLVVILFGGVLGFSKVKAWYYEHKAVKLEQKLKVSKEETKVARKDEAQVTGAAKITGETIEAQDTHALQQRRRTKKATKDIHERIEAVPVAVAVVDDPIVRGAADEAVARAQAAADRLRGTPAH